MQEQIKKLRVHIDGLAQLAKELNQVFIIDTSKLPDIYSSAPEILKQFKQQGITLVKKKEPIEVIEPSRELENTYDSLILGKAWLGKCLGELGEQTPYANDGKRKSVDDIESAADVNSEVPFGDSEGSLWRDKNHIEKVDWLRQEIEKVVNSTKLLGRTTEMSFTKEFNIARTNAYSKLSEARFWLGFELERIKKS